MADFFARNGSVRTVQAVRIGKTSLALRKFPEGLFFFLKLFAARVIRSNASPRSDRATACGARPNEDRTRLLGDSTMNRLRLAACAALAGLGLISGCSSCNTGCGLFSRPLLPGLRGASSYEGYGDCCPSCSSGLEGCPCSSGGYNAIQGPCLGNEGPLLGDAGQMGYPGMTVPFQTNPNLAAPPRMAPIPATPPGGTNGGLADPTPAPPASRRGYTR
jgi:hypothetical protein